MIIIAYLAVGFLPNMFLQFHWHFSWFETGVNPHAIYTGPGTQGLVPSAPILYQLKLEIMLAILVTY